MQYTKIKNLDIYTVKSFSTLTLALLSGEIVLCGWIWLGYNYRYFSNYLNYFCVCISSINHKSRGNVFSSEYTYHLISVNSRRMPALVACILLC